MATLQRYHVVVARAAVFTQRCIQVSVGESDERTQEETTPAVLLAKSLQQISSDVFVNGSDVLADGEAPSKELIAICPMCFHDQPQNTSSTSVSLSLNCAPTASVIPPSLACATVVPLILSFALMATSRPNVAPTKPKTTTFLSLTTCSSHLLRLILPIAM